MECRTIFSTPKLLMIFSLRGKKIKFPRVPAQTNSSMSERIDHNDVNPGMKQNKNHVVIGGRDLH